MISKNRCPKCNTEYGKNAHFCPNCGFDLTTLTANNKFSKWRKYCLITIFCIILGISLYIIVETNIRYHQVVYQPYDNSEYKGMYGANITDELTNDYIVGAILLCISFLGIGCCILKGVKKSKTIKLSILVLLQIFLGVILITNVKLVHQFSLSSSSLGSTYTKKALDGTIWRYSYFENKKNQDDDDGDYKNQIPKDISSYLNKYSHVFLKFNSDGTLGVNVNPYWRDADDTAYQNSQNDNYRTVGTWNVESNGKVNIDWSEADTRAYEYETVKVKKKHHKKHHKKYKYEQRLTPQYTDSYGDPDTSLPRYFPGDNIQGNVEFGVEVLKINNVILRKPNYNGTVTN